MSIGLLYWVLMIIWLIFGLFVTWPTGPFTNQSLYPIGGNLMLFILLFLLGWKSFGFIIRDEGPKT